MCLLPWSEETENTTLIHNLVGILFRNEAEISSIQAATRRPSEVQTSLKVVMEDSGSLVMAF